MPRGERPPTAIAERRAKAYADMEPHLCAVVNLGTIASNLFDCADRGLYDDWSKSAEFKALSAASQSSYRKCISAILYRPQTREAAAKMRAEIHAAKLLGVAEPVRQLEAIATATPSSIGKPELRAFYSYAKSVRGHHMALVMIATLSAAFAWGQESILWRLGPNPREGTEFDHPDGRIVQVAMSEFSAWVAAADAIERASIGDNFYLALFTGQRQTDRSAR